MGQLKSALALKCPRCGEGEVFESKNPFKPGKMLAMHRTCTRCGVRFEREAGFFYGAMYVSYMINIGLFVIATLAWYLFIEDKIDWRLYIGGYVFLTLLIMPLIFRYSRSIWMMWFIKYEPEKRGEK